METSLYLVKTIKLIGQRKSGLSPLPYIGHWLRFKHKPPAYARGKEGVEHIDTIGTGCKSSLTY